MAVDYVPPEERAQQSVNKMLSQVRLNTCPSLIHCRSWVSPPRGRQRTPPPSQHRRQQMKSLMILYSPRIIASPKIIEHSSWTFWLRNQVNELVEGLLTSCLGLQQPGDKTVKQIVLNETRKPGIKTSRLVDAHGWVQGRKKAQRRSSRWCLN